MRSNPASEPLDLDRGLPTTAEDVAALRRAARFAVPDEEFLRFLANFPAPTREQLLEKPGPRGEPFRL